MLIGFIDSLSSNKWLSGIGRSNTITDIIEKTDFTKKDDGTIKIGNEKKI